MVHDAYALQSYIIVHLLMGKLVYTMYNNTHTHTHTHSDVTDSPFPANKRDKENLTERQELAIEFLFCLVLIEVLTQLSVHPVPESFIHTIEDSAFRHFKMQESLKDRYVEGLCKQQVLSLFYLVARMQSTK